MEIPGPRLGLSFERHGTPKLHGRPQIFLKGWLDSIAEEPGDWAWRVRRERRLGGCTTLSCQGHGLSIQGLVLETS